LPAEGSERAARIARVFCGRINRAFGSLPCNSESQACNHYRHPRLATGHRPLSSALLPVSQHPPPMSQSDVTWISLYPVENFRRRKRQRTTTEKCRRQYRGRAALKLQIRALTENRRMQHRGRAALKLQIRALTENRRTQHRGRAALPAPRQALLEKPGFSPCGIASSRNPGQADENGYAPASLTNRARTGFIRTYSQCL
jgi:hypothetical protein